MPNTSTLSIPFKERPNLGEIEESWKHAIYSLQNCRDVCLTSIVRRKRLRISDSCCESKAHEAVKRVKTSKQSLHTRESLLDKQSQPNLDTMEAVYAMAIETKTKKPLSSMHLALIDCTSKLKGTLMEFLIKIDEDNLSILQLPNAQQIIFRRVNVIRRRERRNRLSIVFSGAQSAFVEAAVKVRVVMSDGSIVETQMKKLSNLNQEIS